jgi:hypothetical protein
MASGQILIIGPGIVTAISWVCIAFVASDSKRTNRIGLIGFAAILYPASAVYFALTRQWPYVVANVVSIGIIVRGFTRKKPGAYHGSVTATRFRIRPFEVDAIQWTGRPARGFLVQRIVAMVGDDTFAVLDEDDRANSEDPDASAALRDPDHGTWRPVSDGTWIVRNLTTGRVFQLADDAFRAAYEPLPYVVDEMGVHVYEES